MIKSIEEGRKEDGNRSIADKIIKRLHDLDKTSLENQGRWAWELLQNAKDSISDYFDRKVSVKLEIDNNNVTFSHNGICFTETDIRGLINQISSKEVDDNEETKNTGRFGTGFLTTNLLSRIINVKGIVKTDKSELFEFEFPLNREGNTTKLLAPQIEKSWSKFQSSTKQILKFEETEYNTSFSYLLKSPTQKNIAQIGLDEFVKLIPFALTFNPTIELVEIHNRITNENITFKRSITDGATRTIIKTTNGQDEEIFILYLSNEKLAIATEIEKKDDFCRIKDIKNLPKLFCDFPLIGSEKFHFPVIVNSFYFSPQTERDGVWLKKEDDVEVLENQLLIESAVELYKELIDYITEKKFSDFFNIINTQIPDVNNINTDWYKNNVQEPIRNYLLNPKIVELENISEDKKAIKDIWFPKYSYSNDLKNKIWDFTFDLFPNLVSKKEHINFWGENSWKEWKELTIETLVSTISKQENIKNLSLLLKKGTNETFNWLNSFYLILKEDNNNLLLLDKYKIIPNKNEDFKKKSDIYSDEIKDIELLKILELIGDDWKDILLNDKINFGTVLQKTKKDIADEITLIMKNSNNYSTESIKAISILSEWFEVNNKLGKEFFSELYRKRAQLFMNTIQDKDSLYKVMRSKIDLSKLSEVAQAIDDNPEILDKIKKAEELSNLLSEFNANDIIELKRMLLVAQGLTANNPKLEITQDVLVSLGITSIEELEEALKDKNIAAQFTHSSTPNVELFFYVQTLIKRSKTNIINHLKTLSDYDCSDIEELATTVIGGIKKNNVLINIVVRPSDNGEVIVYYSSEKDTLDFANSELWIDNGIDKPKHLTLGKILKKIGINKIPV